MSGRAILVGMAEIQVARSQAQFQCMGLGSCIGVCALDPLLGVGGVAHIMLPQAPADKFVDKLGKFVDTALPELISRMSSLGAEPSRIRIAVAGGAQVSKFGADQGRVTQIGEKNVQAVQAAIEKLQLRLAKADTGGNMGRTLHFDIETGVVRVRTVNRGERELCSLREAA